MALQVLLRSVLEWTDVQSLLLFLLVFLLISDHFRRRNPKNFPPGPWALPFLGNVFHLDTKQPHIHFNELVKCYGNVFSLRLGGVNTVVVNGYSLVKEALINQGSTFADRPDCPLNRRINNCQGIGFNNGYSWKQQRRFTVSTLRDFGVGKRSLESQILEEIKFLHQAVLEKTGEPFDAHFLVNNAVSNIICSIVFGRRFEYTDERFLLLLKLTSKALRLQGKKVQAEIDRVIGQSRQPTMADRANMPYTDAVIHEIQRMGNIVPLNVPRATSKDTTLGGYFIPKGTQVIPNLTSVLFDGKEWESPHSFDPGHFLNAQGEFVKMDAFLPFSAGNVTYHLGDHACSSAIGYTLRLLTEYTEILIDCLHKLSGFALSLDLKFIAIGAITMIAIHCLTALVIKTRKLRMTVKEINKLQRDMRTSNTSAYSWQLLYEEMKESFGQIKEEAASKAEEYRTTAEAECMRNRNMFEVLKGELVAITSTCEKKEERLVAMTITCELRKEIAAMAVRKLEAMAAKSQKKEEELAAMVQLCQEKEAALQQKMAQEEAQQEEYRKRICVLKRELEGSENALKALVEGENQQVDVKERDNQQVDVTDQGSDQVKDQLQQDAQQQKLAQEEGRVYKKRIRVEFGTYRPKIGWGSADQRQNDERFSQTQKDYQSGQAPMQENRHGCGNEDWSGRAEGAGRRGRGQGGWYRPRPRQRQREWMQHCDR
ncbi:hypothetical protein AAFF_G00132970 [Aldrovandia affinis]|uniref:Cytochrome P450 n=1 Tax=Aldrovandia affinis TaxID=143900 RepID=A0AAD7W8Z6_9TELE|nr:hypothetical protein AAFF_G00132970 [Aldrovandia affinis]